jgi:hypothetical protein
MEMSSDQKQAEDPPKKQIIITRAPRSFKSLVYNIKNGYGEVRQLAAVSAAGDLVIGRTIALVRGL